tara:strand:- start:766 stop:909 length:144 start_codon:yes stop_codon:yes gene_type:complete
MNGVAADELGTAAQLFTILLPNCISVKLLDTGFGGVISEFEDEFSRK